MHGIAPDGAARVTLHGGGETVSADVHDNVYEIRAPVVSGEEIRLELERLEECRPSRELLEAVPALRDGAWQPLPPPAGDPMPYAGVRQWAQRIQTGDELELWAIARCDSVEHACVIGIHGGNWVAQPCESPRDLRNGTWEMFAVPGRVGVAGMAPPGTRGVQFVKDGRVHDVAFTGGAFGGLLPPVFGRSADDDWQNLRVRYLF